MPIAKSKSKPVRTRTSKKAFSIPHGGVSPKISEPAAKGMESLIDFGGVLNAAAAHPNFTYHGGPVVTCPQVYATFWGNGWLSNPAQTIRAGRLAQFLGDLLASKYMNILSQYGSGWGAGSGAFFRSSFVTGLPTDFTDTSIRSTIQSCINAGVLPEPPATSNIVLVVFLDENVGVSAPADLRMCEATSDAAFGYHSFFTTSAGHPFYYAIIPGLNDTCLRESCSSDTSCSLHLSETQEQRQTQVLSHEFAELVTDPQLNAWYDSSGAENGDICNGAAGTITVNGRVWTVQRMYSKYDDVQSNGAVTCVTEPPNPLPKLSPGPTARTMLEARAQQMPSYARLLPLPQIHFDAKALKAEIHEKAVHDYARRLFYPLKVEHLMADFPGFLRQAAEIMDRQPRTASELDSEEQE